MPHEIRANSAPNVTQEQYPAPARASKKETLAALAAAAVPVWRYPKTRGVFFGS